jgi:hypothetical protein
VKGSGVVIKLASLIFCLILPGQVIATPSATAAPLARTDPRVELLSIIFRLADAPEYNQRQSESPYAAAVTAHFGEFRNHDVVARAVRLRSLYGISFDAVMSLAVHLQDARDLELLIPLHLKPPQLDQRWRSDETSQFLAAARRFVNDSEFQAFYQKHEPLLVTAGQRLTEKLAASAYRSWLDSFFGERPAAEFLVLVGMLNGVHCYGVSVLYPGGREVISPVIGVWSWDEAGAPLFDDGVMPTVIHEFSHAYVNPLVSAEVKTLADAGQRLYRYCGDVMRDQAYGSWHSMLNESLVRAGVVRYLAATAGDEMATAEIQKQQNNGFAWIEELSEELAAYEAARDRYPTLATYMPRIAAFFTDYSTRHEAWLKNAPRIVAMEPAADANDVDPQLTEIRVTFDRPMLDQSWSVVGGGPYFPQINGPISYDEECRILTIPVRLKPLWAYEFWLNRGSYSNFRSQDGVPLAPVHVRFKTRRQ